MNSNRSSVDGFVPRRPGSQIGSLHSMKNPEAAVKPIDRSLHTGDNTSTAIVGMPRENKLLGRDDIADSLREIDDTDLPKDRTDRRSRRDRKKDGKLEHPHRKTRRIIKWVIIILGALGLLAGGYVVLKTVLASNSVFQGSIFDIVQNQPLKMDENGRSNFVIFGTAEDDEGGTHGGAMLTDSIMVMSVDQEKKDAYMISLPRDLYVEYQEQCWVGDRGKINAVFTCASNNGEDEAAGAAALQAKVGEITGLDIQYYIHLNFTAVVQAVDAVGGVDVTIESSDPRGILDRNFDWKCNYKCYYVNYKNGEQVLLDGERALALARARNAAGGYGLPGGNFDREQNQQKIIKALREKALSAGTLTNIGAVTGLIDALGQNLRTNVETKEIRTLMDIGQKVESANIVSLSLVEEGNMLVTTDKVGNESIVRPIAGMYDYSEIQSYITKSILSEPYMKEEPQVTVLNGSSVAGKAQTEADKLESLSFIVNNVDNAPEGNYGKATVYQINPDKKLSAAKLASLYGVTLKTTAPPVSVVGDSDFLVIIGATE